jgi:acetyltransferase-like isoleucine patch superfamily enzyme
MKADWKDQWKFNIGPHSSIVDLHENLRDEVMRRWKRCLPFNEELFDRWERARFLGFGEGSNIYDTSLVVGDVKVGGNTWVGPFTILDGSGGLTIGSSCSISSGVQIYTHDSVKWALSGGKEGYDYCPVEIGDCCYIGPLTVVTKGITIGHHCLIGPNSLVNKDIPEYSIAFGSPCRKIGKVKVRDDETIDLVYYPRD